MSGPGADSTSMRRAWILGPVVAASLLLSGCGGSTPSARRATSVQPTPLIVTSTTVTPAVDVAWAPVRVAETQAAQLEAAEIQYATCYAYAGLYEGTTEDSALSDSHPMVTCATTDLTSAEVRQIQDLIVQAT
jgi:hypothetical protein